MNVRNRLSPFLGFKSFPYFFSLVLLIPLLSTSLYSEKTSPPKEDGITITVEKGQTLSIISKTYLDDPKKWKELLKSNQIENPNLIIPGKKLWIPASLGKKPMADLYQFSGLPEVLKTSQKINQWEGVNLGLGLYVKDELRTNDSSVAKVLLTSGSKFEMTENSQIVLEKSKSETEAEEIFLKQGRLRALISKSPLKNKKMFILKTDSALSEVKGTEFITHVDEKGNMTLACYEGFVSVTAERVTVDVKEGYATFVEKGKPPETPFLIPKSPIPLP